MRGVGSAECWKCEVLKMRSFEKNIVIEHFSFTMLYIQNNRDISTTHQVNSVRILAMS